MKSTCLAILNYNGIAHLEHLLPSALAAVDSYEHACPIIVLDNRSTQRDAEWTHEHFPTIEFIRAPKNEFMFSYNWLAQQRKEDILIFLNNDTRLTNDFIGPLVRHLEKPDVFSVCAKSLSWDGATATCGPARLRKHRGVYWWDYERSKQELSHTLFSSSGFMAVDREKFLQLGGFCRLYYPMYCDDLDLGFRAWRRGWRSIYDPGSVLYHRENGSGESKWVRENMYRNSLLFQWSSLPLKGLRYQRTLKTVHFMLNSFRKGQPEWFTVWTKTWFFWLKNQHHYQSMKTSHTELATINAQMDSPVQ
jgi:GT2 family glycosyltransferase